MGAASLNCLFFAYIPLLSQTLTGKSIKIKAGDTITLLTESKDQLTIRFNGIDALEKEQNYGQKSKYFLATFCFEKEVKAHSHGRD